MSGKLVRLACTVTVAAQAAFVPAPATAAPEPRQRSVSQLLTDLQKLYRQTEQATEAYDATADRLTRQKAEVARLDRELNRARLALKDSRADAGRLARQQYQSTSGGLGPYVSLLLAPDPQRALDEGHVLNELARQRARTVARLTSAEKHTDAVARAAHKALGTQLALADKQKKQRDAVQARLADVERLLAALDPDQLAAVDRLEQQGVTAAQRALAGSLADDRPPSPEGERAVRFALGQLGKPYVWGAQGPSAYDCSGLTSQAWQHAGTPIPRTSQEQWHRLRRVPLGRLRPGDLVIYFPEATHVAIYVGGGKVVQAPRPGTSVKISPVASNPVLGAVRPG
ncbi:NlpC/P60 family protein [Streptomyces sp. NPDC048106]|uniref:C40 family peptidase n=1 Tax=Streptomyces sp. NPDC048106 TaxID=3155750 RepID=UPI003451F74A